MPVTTKSEGGKEPSRRPRRPYQPPRLRHLGSVRELTLGGSPVAGEGGGTKGLPGGGGGGGGKGMGKGG